MNEELMRFLRVGLMRARNRATELKQEALVTADAPEKQEAARKEIETLKILEDLILEQVPYENIDHSAR